jgi:hypothetical protein
MPVQPSAGRRRPLNQARIAEKAVVVVMTIEPTDGGVRAIARPQEAWNNATPVSDSRIIGSQSRRDRAIGLAHQRRYGEQEEAGHEVARGAVEQGAHDGQHVLGERIARSPGASPCRT